ncbi:Basic leucine zipper like [Quillaja saponaria]|uniref:Basic leucine zipper like n=1 Tax=Quillaja saponaria TaxID=32244 RepID=A0AAD7M609_QUISA|nr:Basic leucine zipper like [Quillaja saponaria]KAJ7970656.1 Basic leucine zipper like [Quillaja saponaria]
MSRQAHLPPRCPNQKKPITGLNRDYFSSSSCIKDFYPYHQKSPSYSSILEEQPAWLDELLNDPGSSLKEIVHCRSASDSLTLLDTIAKEFSSPPSRDDEEISNQNGTCSLVQSACTYGPNSPRQRDSSPPPHNDEGISAQNETCRTLLSAFTYGPNSPQQRGSLTRSENSKASALLEYVCKDPLHYADDTLSVSETSQSSSKGNRCHAILELNEEKKEVAVKWYSGQRSRVRKLQYIAELESTVDVLQTLASELAIRVGSLIEQRVSLSMENSKLMQHVARLQQQKIIMEGQYHVLQKEVARLKVGVAEVPHNMDKYFGSKAYDGGARSEVSWQLLDMGKLNLA